MSNPCGDSPADDTQAEQDVQVVPFRALAVRPSSTLSAQLVQTQEKLRILTVPIFELMMELDLGSRTIRNCQIPNSINIGRYADYRFFSDGSMMRIDITSRDISRVLKRLRLFNPNGQEMWMIHDPISHCRSVHEVVADIHHGLVFLRVSRQDLFRHTVVCLSLATGAMCYDMGPLLQPSVGYGVLSICMDENNHHLVMAHFSKDHREHSYTILVVSLADFSVCRRETLYLPPRVVFLCGMCKRDHMLYIAYTFEHDNSVVLVYHLGHGRDVRRTYMPGLILSMVWESSLAALLITMRDDSVIYMIDCTQDMS